MKMPHRERILVVEDEKDVAGMLKIRLESAGFSVQTVDCGEAALRQVQENQPELVILDLRLPDIQGYQVCKEIRTRLGPWSPEVLMLTAMAEPIDKARGFAFGADAYMTKPFDSAELLRTVRLLLGSPEELTKDQSAYRD